MPGSRGCIESKDRARALKLLYKFASPSLDMIFPNYNG